VRRLFADTHFFLALLNERDVAHAAASEWWVNLRPNDEVVTTAWVLVELADGMCKPHHRRLCAAFIDDLRPRQNMRVIEPNSALLWRGFDLYRQRPDKEWSLTDCISFVVMGDLGLTVALTNDHHFVQAGFTALLAAE
jgi:uncharacterized protein